MALKEVTFHFLTFCIFFLPFFTFDNEMRAAGFSTRKVENKQFPFQESAGWKIYFRKRAKIRGT
jgi:hypothetical protein